MILPLELLTLILRSRILGVNSFGEQESLVAGIRDIQEFGRVFGSKRYPSFTLKDLFLKAMWIQIP